MKGLHKDSIQDVGNPHQWMIEDARQSALQDVKAEITRRFRKYNEDDNHHLQAAECADILNFLDTLQEQPVSADLEEASDEYADKHGFRVPYDGSENFYDDVDVKASKEGFIAGAKWQAEQDKETIELAEDHAYLAGAVNEREKIMKEAVDADIGMILHDKTSDLFVRSKGYLPKSLGIKCDDKVKLIIVKED